MIKNVYWSSCKVPIILVKYKWNFKFLNKFSKNTQTSNFTKIQPAGAELFHAEEWADMMRLTATFRCSANAPHTETLADGNVSYTLASG